MTIRFMWARTMTLPLGTGDVETCRTGVHFAETAVLELPSNLGTDRAAQGIGSAGALGYRARFSPVLSLWIYLLARNSANTTIPMRIAMETHETLAILFMRSHRTAVAGLMKRAPR